MKINLMPHIAAAGKWDLSLGVEGKDYPTVRPSVGLISRLMSCGELGGKEMIDMAKDLFRPEDQKAVLEWPVNALLAAIPAYLGNFAEQTSKNFPAIAESVGTAIANPSMTPKASS